METKFWIITKEGGEGLPIRHCCHRQGARSPPHSGLPTLATELPSPPPHPACTIFAWCRYMGGSLKRALGNKEWQKVVGTNNMDRLKPKDRDITSCTGGSVSTEIHENRLVCFYILDSVVWIRIELLLC